VQAIVLGLVQGATEFAPISSSGHLIIVPWLFGWSILDDPDLNKTFDVALHVGTLVGALVYLRSDVRRYLAAWFRSIGRRRIEGTEELVAWALVVGTLPGVVAGAALEDLIQRELGEPWLIAVMLAAFGVLLFVVDRRARATLTIDDVTVAGGLALGVAQALALQPGVSRSGVTITAARAMGLDRESAARFSFLLALPIIAGAGLFKAADVLRSGVDGYASEFVWGFVSSAVSGFAVVWGLLRYLRRRDFTAFLVYRLAAAALVLGLIAADVRPAGA
jgi:undecaprenyl-diphosphatase